MVVVEQLRPIVQIMGLVQKLYVPNHVARANEAEGEKLEGGGRNKEEIHETLIFS